MSIGITRPAGLVQYDVKRTTTDKLEEILNAYSEGWTVHRIQHVGGRDWVVVAVTEYASVEERDESWGPE